MIRRLGLPLAGALLLASAACGPRPAATTTPPAEPSPADTEAATPAATATPDLAAAVMRVEAPRILGTFPSPDGTKTAEVLVYDCVASGGEVLAYDVLRLKQVGRTGSIDVATQLQYCEGLGAHGLQGLFWSPNSRYFYFTDAREGGPDGGCAVWFGSKARFDGETGQVEQLGGAVPSPDGLRLAAWIRDGLAVWSIDEPSPMVFTVDLEGTSPGQIAWSPDGTAVATVLMADPCPPWGRSTVLLHSLADGSSRILLESDAPAIGGVEWADGGRLRLIDADGAAWTFDLADGTLAPPE